MRHLFFPMAVLVFFCGSVLFAAEDFSRTTPTLSRKTVMVAAGQVIKISDSFLVIERKVKEETEMMEFKLEKPLRTIVVGDQVKVSYRQEELRNVALRAVKANKTAVRKSPQKTSKGVHGAAPPVAASTVK
ncbi:MAG: hypothetical protein ACYDH8_07065 [Syntrophales bacterium]